AEAGQRADQIVGQIDGAATVKFEWGRFLACVAALLIVVALIIYTAPNSNLTGLNKALLHLFETLGGALAGLIMGEKAARS
ncbi:MAG TPA: hypothetical protein VJX67_14295, partial [Blastocatellia bacterium]|nr:hypothetical protein [Blastocatellia bacterium]